VKWLKVHHNGYKNTVKGNKPNQFHCWGLGVTTTLAVLSRGHTTELHWEPMYDGKRTILPL